MSVVVMEPQVEFKKEDTYKAKMEPELVMVPSMNFVMIDGKGAPSSRDGEIAFQEAMQILFGIVYGIKFWDKKFTPSRGYQKFTLAPVEALWWMVDNREFDMNRPDDWRWTTMLRVPEFVTPEYFHAVVREIVAQKGDPSYSRARLTQVTEGLSVQIMHIGPYDREQPSVESLRRFAEREGCIITGIHHEIYFSDPRRTAPNKLKTILRYAVEKVI